jgi:hypothetical protein
MKKNRQSKTAAAAEISRHNGSGWRRWLPLGLACSTPPLLRAENQVDYRYEYYVEDGNRMEIQTHSVYFEQKLIDRIIAKGELTYDGVSGATPVGTHYHGHAAMLKPPMFDIRRSINLEFDGRLANHTVTPGFAYSKEHDYQSYGISLNDAMEFNDKNTILQLGVSHNFDSVRKADKHTWLDKDATEVIIGVSQLLSPKTIFNADFTLGNDTGYLSDPYRLAEFHPVNFPATSTVGVIERRPSQRTKEVLFTSLTYYVEPLNASIEGSYRFYHDSYDVSAHTVELTWHQWLGKHIMVEPLFRISEQSAASFYTTTFSGPFAWILNPAGPPGFHSSDYRLSEFYSIDYGLQASVLVTDWMKITAGYHRYEMNGLDGKTTADMYPKANIFTVGIAFTW